MALVKLSFSGEPQTKINTIDIDVLTTESPTFQNTITQNPTEEGKNVSDNIINNPITLTLSCIVTDFSRIAGRQTDAGEGRRSSLVFFDLKQLRNDKTIFKVQTGLDLYENMAIASFRPVRNASNTNALEFSIDFQEVLKVSSQTVVIPRAKIKSTPANAKDQAQGTVNKGSQQTTPASTKSSSFAFSLWNTFFK